MSRKVKIAHKKNTENVSVKKESTNQKFRNNGPGSKWDKSQIKDFFLHPISLAVISAGLTLLWVYIFENMLVQYVPSWLYILSLLVATFIVATLFSNAFSQDDQRKAVKRTPFVVIIIIQFLPLIDMAKFDEAGTTLEWINIENGATYHRPANKTNKDSKGEYFFDPRSGDTCRRATDHWLEVYEEKNYTPRRVYVITYDTLINEVYSARDADKDGVLRTNVYGYDLNKLENPEVVIINLKTGDENSVVIGHVNTCKYIYASYRQPEARYKYKDRVTKNLETSIPLTFKGHYSTKAQVLVLDKKRVRQSLAQN